jgi:hypothetical protein
MISGKPVKLSIVRTSRPADSSSAAVPPVETSSTPSADRPRAKSTTPRLSETDSSARRICTAAGAVSACALSLSGSPAMAARISAAEVTSL